MHNYPPNTVFGPAINRLTDVMEHCDRFAFRGSARLAHDAGVSPSSVGRLIHGQINPSVLLVLRIRDALERQLGFSIDVGDLIAECGRFRTRYLCEAVKCRGCLPDRATGTNLELAPAFVGVEPGEWVTSKYPNGYAQSEVGL
ncbi:MAG: helix-turn-helix transcriptional regulator [Armatimonadetes bacterium]|nr:helix-turn-helix transcriptional regulator [Armatimonadota bacterium]